MNAKTHSPAEGLDDKRQGLPEEIWAQFRTVLRQQLKAMLEQALEEELRQQVGAGRRYERCEDRQGYRNGHYRRRRLTRYGDLEALAVPRAEEGGVEFQAQGRYPRRQLEIDKILVLLRFLNVVALANVEDMW